MKKNSKVSKERKRNRWSLLFVDLVVFIVTALFFLLLMPSTKLTLGPAAVIWHMLAAAIPIFVFRLARKVYRQIWRYGGGHAYLRLIEADIVGGLFYFLMETFLPKIKALAAVTLWGRPVFVNIPAVLALSLVSVDLLAAIVMRLLYQYLYQYSSQHANWTRFFCKAIKFFTGVDILDNAETEEDNVQKIRIAIVGAGRVGTGLAAEIRDNPHSSYQPVCFVDIDEEKVGRNIYELPVLSEKEATAGELKERHVQEVVFALPNLPLERKKELYERYQKTGCRLKVYDFPTVQSAAGGRRSMREFDIEDLLFRETVELKDETTKAYYQGKTVMITGGGGSIGSELCRQIIKMKPKKLIILDVYENGAYDIQQEIKNGYPDTELVVEIATVCDRSGLEKIFAKHRPDVVIGAAAHKHVPLMEHNCCEAVKNNVFGTLNTVELSEKYGAERFMMVSTDKAVNPTNVMGATKRMCELIVMCHAANTKTNTTFSCTRFGNVLGSAGSVIPLFKRQIENGGPVTLTDRRIIRYFMTIPEASQLVLESAAKAKNGELFVLDMGKPIKILDLAESMIRLGGYEPYKDIDIIETGLRPGEKLYEELLVKTEELDKTDNKLIFIERSAAVTPDELKEKLEILKEAIATEDNDTVRTALHRVVPTYRTPEEVNAEAVSKRQLEEKKA